MQIPLWHNLRRGYAYLTLWPQRRELTGFFPEQRVITAILFAQRQLVPAALISIALVYYYGNASHWPAVSITLLFMVSLPAQGYYWLGLRANTPLPLSLADWYRHLVDRLQAQGISHPSVIPPTYYDLAALLRQGFTRLDNTFGELL